MPGVVGRVGLCQAGVQLGQRADLRDGDHPAAAEPPDLAFHTAFFMSSRLSRLTIERAEPVPGAEGQPPGGLGAAAAGQHLGHRRGQVVVPDVPPRHPARGLERGHVPFQEGFLSLAGIHPVAGLAGERQAVGEQVALGQMAGQLDEHVTEIHLGLGARLLSLRHEPVRAAVPSPRRGGDPGAAPLHVLGHGRIRHLRVMFIAQPLEDPPGGMPLLARRPQVLAQHLIDPPGHGLPHRRRPHRLLAVRRQRRADRLAHRTAVHVVLAGQRPHPQPLPLVIPADRGEQLHPRPHPGPTQMDKHRM